LWSSNRYEALLPNLVQKNGAKFLGRTNKNFGPILLSK
jgi:hypothetical protein